jgi:hypothetical protein
MDLTSFRKLLHLTIRNSLLNEMDHGLSFSKFLYLEPCDLTLPIFPFISQCLSSTILAEDSLPLHLFNEHWKSLSLICPTSSNCLCFLFLCPIYHSFNNYCFLLSLIYPIFILSFSLLFLFRNNMSNFLLV